MSETPGPVIKDAGASTLVRYQASSANPEVIAQGLAGVSVDANRAIAWGGKFNTLLRFPTLDGKQSVDVLSNYDPTVPTPYAEHPYGTSSYDIPKFSGTPETEILTGEGHIALINRGSDTEQEQILLISPEGFLENATELPDFLIDAPVGNLPTTDQAQAAATDSPIAE